MKLIIALAAGLLATGATAQTTITRTTVTPSHNMTMTHTTTRHHTEMRDADMNRHHARTHRVCHTKWRNHHRIRTCRTERWR